MEAHPAANLFPPMTPEEFASLKADIATHGVREAIWTWRGLLLDGRHRYQACHELGIPCPTREWDGDEDDIDAFVMSLNVKRRHLTASQWAMVGLAFEARAAERAKLRQASTQLVGKGTQAKDVMVVARLPPPSRKGKAREEAASLVGVSPRYISDAKALIKAMPERAEDVRLGKVTLPAAMREVRHAEKVARPLPTDKYRVFYADPPWKYGDTGLDDYGHAERHYPSMSIRDLCDLPIRDMASDDAVLFLWVTSPLLHECFAVIQAWGFEYKTSFVWDKVKHNFGHYNSVRHELLLICTRGSCTPDSKELIDSVQTIERSATHSEKPEEFRAIIDKLYTRGKRIELFARTRHENWAEWGNENDP